MKTLIYTGLAALALMGAGCKDNGRNAPLETQENPETIIMETNAPYCGNKPRVTMAIEYLDIQGGRKVGSVGYTIACGDYEFEFREHQIERTGAGFDGCRLHKNGNQEWRNYACDRNLMTWNQKFEGTAITLEQEQQYKDMLAGMGVPEAAKIWARYSLQSKKLGGLMEDIGNAEMQAINAPSCGNQPDISMSADFFRISCGAKGFEAPGDESGKGFTRSYLFTHSLDYSLSLSEFEIYENELHVFGEPGQLWYDKDGDGKLEEYYDYFDPATEAQVQQYNEAIPGIGQPEVQAKFEEWLKANGQ